MNFKYYLAAILLINLLSCEVDNIGYAFNKNVESYFIYATPYVGDTVLDVVVARASTFVNENPPLEDILLKDAKISFKNKTTGIEINTFKIDYTSPWFFPRQGVPFFRAKMPEKFLNLGDIIELKVSLNDKIIAQQVDTVPPSDVLLSYSVFRNEALPSQYQNIGSDGRTTRVNVSLIKSKYNHHRLELFRIRDNLLTKPASQIIKVDDQFFENRVESINPSRSSVIKRINNPSNYDWIYDSPSIIDTISIDGDYNWYQMTEIIRPLVIRISPLKRALFLAELYSILENEVNYVFNEPTPYPSNLNCKNCIGNFQIINPIVINVE
ncbi:MAG TPA: hypothetical protein PKD85_16225 [Saprospiraceae bacterium]|nr:hypothetical protein [Saprospiraceae bacterium]